MKFILSCPKIKLHDGIYNTAQKSAQQSAQVHVNKVLLNKKFIEKLVFLCVLVFLNKRKIKFNPQFSIEALSREIALTW